MARSDDPGRMFGPDTPVLRLDPRGARGDQWVLWPVFSWRVVVPVPRERKLNLFQRAVLGLARGGFVRIGEVADHLLITPDLAAFVVQELQGMGFMDHHGAPTPRGIAALEDLEEEPPDQMRVGHVLSDAFSGKLWPRFLPGDLPLAEVEVRDDGLPILLSGPAGDPIRERTFSVLPGRNDSVLLARPGARDVLKAAKRHRRQREIDEVNDERDVPRLRRVSFVEERAQPYLFALRLRRHDSGDWMAEDPFGHGESVELRAALEKRLDTQANLRSWLAPLIGADPAAPTLGHLQTEAAWKVEERLTVAIRTWDPLRDRLIAMQRALLEASGDGAPKDKWDDVIVKAQRAVERALHIIYEPSRGCRPPLYEKLNSNKDYNQTLLDTMAGDLGFHSPLPENLSSVRRGKVQDAEQSGGGSLRPLLILTLLCADADETHPLRRASRQAPDLLHRLDALAMARDRFAAHDGPALWPQTVPGHVETAFTTVETLFLSR